ncbi:MAG: hypothetical protein MJE66_05820 [Proteobacteria bacterium]|nr:hypothetical protein [Pseudomonadota bacterium]
MSYDDLGPTTVSYPMATTIYAYIKRMMALGAIEGRLGDNHLARNLEPVVEAMHEVLAGGEVSIDTVRPGHADIKRELDEYVRRGTDDANTINSAAGYYVSLAP